MSKILFTWECGAGLGHLTRYSNLIDLLIEEGHDIFFAVRSLSSAIKVLKDKKVTLVQAPTIMGSTEGAIKQPRSYLHVLQNQGFASPEGLKGRYLAWLNLYGLIQPDLIINDHSPTAVFTAQQYKEARLVMSGNGFAVPPLSNPFTSFPLAPFFSAEDWLKAEIQFLDQYINPLVTSVGQPQYEHLCDAFATDTRWLFSFQEFDHYANRQTEHYLGTGFCPPGKTPAWPGGKEPRVFAYLKPHRELVNLLQQLQHSGFSVLIKGDQIPAEIEQQFSGQNISFAKELQDLNLVAEQCDIAITNGSPSTSARFVLSGKPVLLMPLHIEQLLSSIAIQNAGCGILTNSSPDQPFSYVETISKLTEAGSSHRQAAEAFSQKYADYDTDYPNQFMLQDINRLLAIDD